MPRNRSLPLDALGVGLALGFGLAVAAGAVASLPSPPDAPAAEPGPETPATPATPVVTAPIATVDDPVRRTPVVEAVERVPSVVSITCEIPTSDPFLMFQGGRPLRPRAPV